VLGLLGGIGSGKSLVAGALARRGARVLDADRMAHAALERPAVRRRLAARWGRGILGPDGRVNRAALAARAFGSPRAVRALNRIVHPAVRRQIEQEIRKAKMETTSRKRLIALDAPLLMEAGIHRLCDVLVFVEAPRALRHARARRRSGWPAEELARRERFQIPLGAKRKAARFVIDNSKDRRHVEAQVRTLLEALGHDE
jgi:dephospho-CoA kinase